VITPTIGRVVLVHRHNSGSDQREPAFVTYVHDTNRINVCGFTKDGRVFNEQSIQLLQDDDRPEDSGTFAEWMPYQKEQAAKQRYNY
jgi:hypothetical protein